MDSIHKLFSFFFDFTLVGAGLFFAIKLLQFRSNLNAKNDLQKLQARISILRMNIRAKVKKRTNAFRTFFSAAITPDEVLDKDLTSMLNIKFEAGPDFQQYFDYIKNTHSLVAALHKDLENPMQKYLDEDAKRELVIIRFVKEIKETSAKYNEKVEVYNKINPKNKMTPADPIQFELMTEIERILSMERVGSDNVENQNQTTEKKTEAA